MVLLALAGISQMVVHLPGRLNHVRMLSCDCQLAVVDNMATLLSLIDGLDASYHNGCIKDREQSQQSLLRPTLRSPQINLLQSVD